MKELKDTKNNTMDLRVSHKTLADCDFNIPVTSPEEGYKFMEVLSCYDYFQLGRIGYSGLQYYNENNKKWEEWHDNKGQDIYDYAEDIDLDYYDIWLMNPQKEIVDPQKIIPNFLIRENEELIKPREYDKIEKIIPKINDLIKNNNCIINITTKYNQHIIIKCYESDKVIGDRDYDTCEIDSIRFSLKNDYINTIFLSDLTYIFVKYDENKNLKSIEFNYEKDSFIYIKTQK